MSYKRYDPAKRLTDLLLGGLGMAVTAPLQIAIAVAVAGTLGRPVLFRQVRPGRYGKPFTLIKFRTMREPDHNMATPSDAQRLTRFGRLLRATSLDELPSLWNVVTGEMSLVGPRPLLPSYLTLYSPTQARRHEVRPGLTGLAQVRGRNSLSWSQRLNMDIEYVDRRSFRMDAWILLATFRTVLRGHGVTAEGHATMTPFTGEDREGDA